MKLVDFTVTEKSDRPVYPTSIIGSTPDGRFFCEGGPMWAYFAVPLNPTFDAKTEELRLQTPAPLYNALDELCRMNKISGIKLRRIQRGGYRQFHILSINLDAMFHTPYADELSDMLNTYYEDVRTIRRVVLLGVQLNASVTSHGLWGAVESIASTFQSGRAPASDFDDDFTRVKTTMARHGLGRVTKADMALARSWWNLGRPSDTYYMAEPSRYHLFRTADAASQCQNLYEAKVPSSQWPDSPDHYCVTMASVREFDIPHGTDALSAEASWLSALIDNDALCISIRGALEPGIITAREIDRNTTGYTSDVNEAAANGRNATPEQQDKLNQLAYMRDVYRGAGAPTTATDVSVTVAFNGDGSDLDKMSIPLIDVSKMESRQVGAMAETWLCPVTRVNPARHDLPLETIAYSGICSLSHVGDHPKGSALTGFTERDRQPAWTNPAAAMTLADSPPLVGVFGMSGSGKTMFGVWHLIQFSALSHKTIFINPKEESDFEPLFTYYGGVTIDLGDIASSDGILDPLRFEVDPLDGIDMAISTLKFLNPWDRSDQNVEVALYAAIRAGVQAGATSTLGALHKARELGVPGATRELIDPIETIVHAVPMASALIGTESSKNRLAFDNDLTLIQLGSAKLNLPKGGKLSETMTLSERIAVSVVRMLVRGSTIAVRGDAGVVGLDEAWIFFDTAGDELESLGRLARSMDVAIWLLTQRVTDVQRANLSDFISTSYILGMNAEEEAKAACRLARIEPTPSRIQRMMAPAKIKGQGGATAFNWASQRALVDEETRKTIRGAICLYMDVSDRAVYVEVPLPDEFLHLASTNKIDRQRSGRVAPARKPAH